MKERILHQDVAGLTRRWALNVGGPMGFYPTISYLILGKGSHNENHLLKHSSQTKSLALTYRVKTKRGKKETWWRSILTSWHTDFFRPCDGSRTEQSRAIAQVWTRQRKKLPETSYIVLDSLSLLWKKGESLLNFTRQSGKGIEQMLGNHCPVFLCPFPLRSWKGKGFSQG